MKKILLTTALVAANLLAVAPQVKDQKSRTFSQSQYMPDISLVTDFTYVHRNKKDSEMAHLEMPGIAHGVYAAHNHGGITEKPYNAEQGFNLNYAELILSSNVDPYFSMDAVFHFSEEGVEVEEAYFTTTSLPGGLRARAGKLYSEFGRLNQQHHHFWDFGDQPLVYQGFLGNHNLNELGVQLQWVAPTSTYLMIGAELLQGTNERMFGNTNIANPYDEELNLAEEKRAPSMVVGYVKTSIDVGDTTILPGISYVYGSSRLDHFEDEEPHAIAGHSAIVNAELTVKHFFNSYSFLTWQSEWMKRDMDGTLYEDADGDLSTVDMVTSNIKKQQAGYYTQLVYALDQNYRFGVRYDNIYHNVVNGTTQEENLDRYSLMAEYHPSEFSRIRLQYNRDSSLFNEDGERQHIDTVMLQFNIAIGAHAAHDF